MYMSPIPTSAARCRVAPDPPATAVRVPRAKPPGHCVPTRDLRSEISAQELFVPVAGEKIQLVPGTPDGGDHPADAGKLRGRRRRRIRQTGPRDKEQEEIL